MKLPCPRCRTKIDAQALRCAACHTNFNDADLDDLRHGWIRGMAINLIAVLGLGFLLFQCTRGSPPAEQTVAAAPARVNDPAKCEQVIDGAVRSGLVRTRPSAVRIDVEDAIWASAPAREKRVLMEVLACSAFDGIALSSIPAGDNVVAYGTRSGKRVAMATSAGVRFE